jgi:hypothetical protein
MSCHWFEPMTYCTAGEHSSEELLQQLVLLLFGTSTVSQYLEMFVKCKIHEDVFFLSFSCCVSHVYLGSQ